MPSARRGLSSLGRDSRLSPLSNSCKYVGYAKPWIGFGVTSTNTFSKSSFGRGELSQGDWKTLQNHLGSLYNYVCGVNHQSTLTGYRPSCFSIVCRWECRRAAALSPTQRYLLRSSCLARLDHLFVLAFPAPCSSGSKRPGVWLVGEGYRTEPRGKNNSK